MDSISDLVEFWRKLECAEKPAGFLHPLDRKHVIDKGAIHPQSPTEFFRDHLRTKGPDRRIIASLIPKPFIGSLERSRVVIVLANPGFEPGDLSETGHGGFQDALWQNLRQTIPPGKFPFFFLNPEFAWHPGFRWWNRVLGKLIKDFAPRHGSELGALSFLADRIVCIESFPYHSAEFPGGWAWKLPSSKKAKAAVDHLIVKRDRLVHIIRPREWSRALASDGTLLVGSANSRNCALSDEALSLYRRFLIDEAR